MFYCFFKYLEILKLFYFAEYNFQDFCLSNFLFMHYVSLKTSTRGVLCHWKRPNWSSHQRCSVKKEISENYLEISENSQENNCSRVSFLIKKETVAQVFPDNFAKFLRAPFLLNTSRQLLLRHSVQCWFKKLIFFLNLPKL